MKDADPKGELLAPYPLTPDFDPTKVATQGSNILYHAFPPPVPASLGTLLSKLRMLQYGAGGCLVVVWLSVAFGSGIWKFVWRSIICSVVGFALMTGISIVERGIEKEVERVRQDLGRQRGEAFSPPTPESVEWLNGLIKLIWGLIDPFVPFLPAWNRADTPQSPVHLGRRYGRGYSPAIAARLRRRRSNH